MLLRRSGIVPQNDIPSDGQPLLLRLDSHIQVVLGEGERFTIETATTNGTNTESPENVKKLHPQTCAPALRLCRTIS